MKKRIVVLSILIAILLSSCGSSISQEDYDKILQERNEYEKEYNNVIKERDEYKEKYETLLSSIPDSKNTQASTKNTEEPSKSSSDTESFLENIEKVNEYKWNSSSYYYIGIELKNNNDSTLRLDSEFIFYDEDNNIIGTKKTDYVAFESQSNILLYIANEDPFDHYECNLNPREDNTNNPVKSLLKSEVSETDSKLIFSITNTGDADALFVKCTVLFLRGGEPVSLTYSYAGTSNGKILPSETERAEIKKPYNTPYDEYILFLDGRGK